MTDYAEALKKIKQIDDEGYNDTLQKFLMGDVKAIFLSYAQTLDRIREVVDQTLESEDDRNETEYGEKQEDTDPINIFGDLGLDSLIPLIRNITKTLHSDTSIKDDASQTAKDSSDPLSDFLSRIFKDKP